MTTIHPICSRSARAFFPEHLTDRCHLDRPTREKALSSLRLYLTSSRVFSDLELHKLWKGLFFCKILQHPSTNYSSRIHPLNSLQTPEPQLNTLIQASGTPTGPSPNNPSVAPSPPSSTRFPPTPSSPSSAPSGQPSPYSSPPSPPCAWTNTSC